MARKKDPWGDAVGDVPWARRVAPAPGDLRIVQALANTIDLETGNDELASPQALGDWLARWRLVSRGTKIGKADLERAIVVRDGLRLLLGANRGGALDAEAMARLDQALGDATYRLRVGADGSIRFEPASEGFDGAVARLFEIVARARLEDRWRRLKLCEAESCRRAFYDTSKSRTGKWCSMRFCGNRSKAESFRRRHPGRKWYGD